MATTAQPLPTVNAHLFASGTEQLGTPSGGIALPKQAAAEPSPEIVATLHVAVPVGQSQILPSARPDRLLFGALNDPEFRLRQSIPLTLSVDESGIVVTWLEVEEFGYGQKMGTALDDFGQSIRELYRRLYSRDIQLGPDLQNVKRILGEYIEPRNR